MTLILVSEMVVVKLPETLQECHRTQAGAETLQTNGPELAPLPTLRNHWEELVPLKPFMHLTRS